MDVFVVLSLALAVFMVGMVVVAVVVLRRQLQGLTAAVQRTAAQIDTVTTELNDELAVLTLESEALQRRLAGGRDGAVGGYTPGGDSRIPAGS